MLCLINTALAKYARPYLSAVLALASSNSFILYAKRFKPSLAHPPNPHTLAFSPSRLHTRASGQISGMIYGNLSASVPVVHPSLVPSHGRNSTRLASRPPSLYGTRNTQIRIHTQINTHTRIRIYMYRCEWETTIMFTTISYPGVCHHHCLPPSAHPHSVLVDNRFDDPPARICPPTSPPCSGNSKQR